MLVYIIISFWRMIADKVLGQKAVLLNDHPLSWAWCFDLDGYLGLWFWVGAGVGLEAYLNNGGRTVPTR
jgi:hypothetical protein